jgi:hypothetical protein
VHTKRQLSHGWKCFYTTDAIVLFKPGVAEWFVFGIEFKR